MRVPPQNWRRDCKRSFGRANQSLDATVAAMEELSRAKVHHVAAAIRSIAADWGKIRALVDEVNVASQERSRGDCARRPGQ